MERLFYPAIFHEAEEGGFWVTFPDFPESMTQGDDMTKAYEMASDALGMAITERIREKEVIPQASKIEDIADDGKIVIVQFDQAEYNRKHNNKAVKKTLSIPEWLNEEALERNINFSQVLQEALMEKMGLR